MALYDSTATYDSSAYYDEVLPATPRKKMSKIKLNLKAKTDSELVTFAQQHITAMTGNAAFPTPVPAAAPFAALATGFSTTVQDSLAAQQTAKLKTALKDTARAALEAGLTQRANTIQGTPGITDAQILSAGFSLQTSTTTTVPGLVANLSLTAGDNAGELDWQWDPNSNADRYEAQWCAAMDFASNVTTLPSVSKSKLVALGLTSGSRVYGRVRAVNAAGIGAWSDVATKIVP